MVCPFPRVVGPDRSQDAVQIFGDFKRIAKLSDDLAVVPEIDLKQLSQLAFRHCQGFASAMASPSAELLTAVETRLALEGHAWRSTAEMATDLAAVRVAADAFFVYVRDNVPQARVWAERTNDATGREIEISKTLSLPHPVTAEIATLRAEFAAS